MSLLFSINLSNDQCELFEYEKNCFVLFSMDFCLQIFFFKGFTKFRAVEGLCTKANENLYHMFGDIINNLTFFIYFFYNYFKTFLFSLI